MALLWGCLEAKTVYLEEFHLLREISSPGAPWGPAILGSFDSYHGGDRYTSLGPGTKGAAFWVRVCL